MGIHRFFLQLPAYQFGINLHIIQDNSRALPVCIPLPWLLLFKFRFQPHQHGLALPGLILDVSILFCCASSSVWWWSWLWVCWYHSTWWKLWWDTSQVEFEILIFSSSGKTIGNCLTKSTGKFWCYVPASRLVFWKYIVTAQLNLTCVAATSTNNKY